MESVTGLLARSLHLLSSILLVGGAATLLLAGPSDRPSARRWEAWILRGCTACVLLALASALVAVAAQTALLEGRPAAAFEPAALSRFLLQTQGGTVWLVRGGLLVMLGAFLAVRLDIRDRTDWRAARGEVAVLGLLALGLVAGAGHAAAVEPGTAGAIAADVVHLAAGGIWSAVCCHWRCCCAWPRARTAPTRGRTPCWRRGASRGRRWRSCSC
jgi:putative copper resistance protein D